MHTFSSSPVLSRLSTAAQGALRAGSVTRHLDAGAVIVVGGETSERVHLITEGAVKLLIVDAAGNESLVALALAGDLIGDVAALDCSPEPFDAIAATAVTLVSIERERFIDIMSTDPRALLELATDLAVRVRSFSAAATERGSRYVEARLAGRLLELANVVGRMSGGTIELEMPLCQTDLARLSGTSRESACRTLRRFKEEGVLDYEPGHFRIFRPDVLERIRCGERAAKPSRSANGEGCRPLRDA